jgi:xylulokinase
LFLGIDLGTSAVKVVLVDDGQRLVDQASVALAVSRPRPLWSEQDPEDWWRATDTALCGLRERRGRELGGVLGIGLSGQMHGATLLDAREQSLRPAILWNDGRSAAECLELERRVPRAREISGNLAMPGFTAPKLLWVARHEPDIFARTQQVLLPKDYLRLRLSGERVSEMSDASGTLWLDVAKRAWSDELLAACSLRPSAMPRLIEGSEKSAELLPELARRFGVPERIPIAGGAGDQAAGAIGAGVIRPGDAFLSLGSSGVAFAADSRFSPNPAQAVHAFCHALPNTWHQMSVILSAASCLSWFARVSGVASESALLAEIEAAGSDLGDVFFLPYLSGERTPHNDPLATGVFVGLRHDSTRADLGRAVLEGVAFALADGLEALCAAGATLGRIAVIGGGARSRFWGAILANALCRPLGYARDAEIGPAFGAARLGRLAATGETPESVCTPLPIELEIAPDPRLRERYREKHAEFRKLYRALRNARTPGEPA